MAHKPYTWMKFPTQSNRKFFTFILIATIFGFLLHLAWEFAQCTLFFVHEKAIPTLSTMLSVSVGDVAIMWFAYLFVSLLKRTVFWGLSDWGIFGWLSFVLVSAFVVEVLEYRAIRLGLWSYTSINPVINPMFDPMISGLSISVIPIFQMLIVNSISLAIARRMTLRLT